MSLISTRFHAVMLRLSIFVLLTFLCSCASTIKEVPAKHVVMFDEYSRLLDPTGNTECTNTSPRLCEGKHLSSSDYLPLDAAQEERYMDELLADVRNAKEKGKKLLIFVHGGLNTQTGSVKRVKKLTPRILDAGYYPIFINWRSSWAFSYFNHLFLVRQGEEMTALGPVSSPVVLVYDAGRAVLRAPLVWSSQIYGWTESLPGSGLSDDLNPREAQLMDAQTRDLAKAIRIMPGVDKRSDSETASSGVSWFVLGPIRMLTAPLIDGFGTSAWDNMLRQTQLLIHTMKEYRGARPTEVGGLARVMNQIKDQVKALKERSRDWEIMLVGHSMGTIVLNDLLRDIPDFPADTIVYMAAACSVRDFEQSVLPYLRRPDNQTKFYNLSLQRRAEEGERNYMDFVIRGSLLTWIDEFFANPMTPTDRTLGRYVNFLRTEQIFSPENLRGRVYQKEFNYGDSVSKTDPQKHGDFDRCPFWEKDFYSLVPPSQDPKLFCSDD